jgi:hypothetical protein
LDDAISALSVEAAMPLMGPIPEGQAFFCPRCGAHYAITHSRRGKTVEINDDRNVVKCVVCGQTMVRGMQLTFPPSSSFTDLKMPRVSGSPHPWPGPEEELFEVRCFSVFKEWMLLRVLDDQNLGLCPLYVICNRAPQVKIQAPLTSIWTSTFPRVACE